MNVRDDRHEAAALAKFRDYVLQVRRVFHRRRGDADNLTTDGGQIQGLPHALGGIHSVAGEHGLHDDRMLTADDDAALRRIAHQDFPGFSAAVKIWSFAIAHGVCCRNRLELRAGGVNSA